MPKRGDTATRVNVLLFASIGLVTIVMAATWAHLLEMPVKMTLTRDEYFTVQQIYSGWAWLGIVIFIALTSTSALIVAARSDRAVAAAAAISTACIVLALLVFFTYTFPANQATVNWTSIPDNWATLRRHWEYGHAAEALFHFGALLSLAAAASLRHP